ncbi:hypothetical protein [Streptomyces europaeiscabiei]|uniref:hypothetical protein n=1 Tax=Streptomyces europaeiscabiei TaxID=146819 RepID=UPI00131B86FB|nr:hypothetical protein [Streptomyces europaeiscabiei]MDX3666346.1 hypothetical protein [Streptomyces europaeiscabiei]MDX3838188.1 hypothetical protein [Streptomyces europaeiscabiei]MDX3840790.1 hypothetical protein [Streptomyces europaeiscabiei]
MTERTAAVVGPDEPALSGEGGGGAVSPAGGGEGGNGDGRRPATRADAGSAHFSPDH